MTGTTERRGTNAGLEVVIEPMRPDDWPAVERIYAAGIETGDATLERAAPPWQRFDAEHRPDGRFVARRADDGTVVGWVAMSPYSSRAVYAGVAWESVYVAPEAQGRGVGARLLAHLTEHADAAGIWTLCAGVLADNAASLAVHARAGFRIIGVQHGIGQDRTGRWRDVVLLERRRDEP
jgi:L-amino acid N-acyltransferase YncA